jgi:hypothetical protein
VAGTIGVLDRQAARRDAAHTDGFSPGRRGVPENMDTARVCGRRLSLYLGADALELLEPWSADRLRSARLAAVLGRYATLVRQQRPDLEPEEWAVTTQLIGELASIHDAQLVWAAVQNAARDRRPLPGIDDPERLAIKLRRATAAELLGVLEIADRVALAPGSLPLRERLRQAGVPA